MRLCRIGERFHEPVGRRHTGGELVGTEEQHETVVGVGHHRRDAVTEELADGWRLVVAVVGVERHGEPGSAGNPVGALPDAAVGDVAQSAMGPAESCTDPVGQLAAKGAAAL
jgi:hypothetical protein